MEHISIWPVLVLALINLFGTKLKFLGGVPRSVWLSVAGGVSVAYVFLHLFPELSEGQKQVEQVIDVGSFLENHVYLMALFGLSFFYGLERAVVNNEHKRRQQGKGNKPSGSLFWIHIGSFSVYNGLIGYVLFQREEGALRNMILFSVAMALHFIVNDFGLQEKHKERYQRVGRWVLVVALMVGWVVGYQVKVPEAVLALITAFIGGGIILNVLKEELPEERQSRYWAFVLGVAAYAILLLSIT